MSKTCSIIEDSFIQRVHEKLSYFFKLNITVSQFTRKVDTNCLFGAYLDFASLFAAEEACNNDEMCGKIEDTGCKGTALKLCKKGAKESRSQSETCLHVHPRDSGKYLNLK